MRQSALDAFLAAGEGVGEADVDEEQLRGELAISLERARTDIGRGDDADLVSSLRWSRYLPHGWPTQSTAPGRPRPRRARSCRRRNPRDK